MNTEQSQAQINRLNERWQRVLGPLGSMMVDGFHYLGLFAIGFATVWAAAATFVEIFQTKHHASVDDLLLLFIYLEIGAMVGIYFKTNHMPVRFLIYVAITAATRHMIIVVNHHNTPQLDLLIIAGVILTLTVASLAVRFASYKYPAVSSVRDKSDLSDADGSSGR